ncbi:MAG: hypothetical protein LBV67_09590 [Streptococcaceae bacterium]|jgi:hypothetical protein|nr:hypothetical protein [Streptococcaceae bacterium]
MNKKFLTTLAMSVLVMNFIVIPLSVQAKVNEISPSSVEKINSENAKIQTIIGPIAEIEEVIVTRDLTENPFTEEELQFIEYIKTKDVLGIQFRNSTFGTRLQNGGVNFFYNTAKGKSNLISAFNEGIKAANNAATASTIVQMFGTAAGAPILPAAVTNFLVQSGTAWLKNNLTTMKNRVNANGNTGTVRVTLTEVRWSSKYDNKW